MLIDSRRRAPFLVVLLSLSCLASEAQVRHRNAAAEMVARANAQRRAEEHEKKLWLDVEELVRLTEDLRDDHSAQAKQKLDRVEKLAKSIHLLIIGVEPVPPLQPR